MLHVDVSLYTIAVEIDLRGQIKGILSALFIIILMAMFSRPSLPLHTPYCIGIIVLLGWMY